MTCPSCQAVVLVEAQFCPRCVPIRNAAEQPTVYTSSPDDVTCVRRESPSSSTVRLPCARSLGAASRRIPSIAPSALQVAAELASGDPLAAALAGQRNAVAGGGRGNRRPYTALIFVLALAAFGLRTSLTGQPVFAGRFD